VSLLIAGVLFVVFKNPLLLAITLAGILGFLLASYPQVLWFLLIAFLPFSMEVKDILGAGNNLTLPTEALAPLTGLAFALVIVRNGSIRWTASPLHVTVGVYLLVQWLSLLWSEIPLITLKALLRGTTGFMGGYLLTQLVVRSEKDLRRLCLLMMGLIPILVCYGFFTQIKEGFRIYQDVAYPFFDDHCVYAAFLCFPAALGLAMLTQPVRHKPLIALFVGLVSLGILATFVRGAWLGMAFLVLYLLIRQRAALSFRFAFALTVLFLIGMITALYLGLQPLLMERWQTLFDIRYVANESRIDRWMAALSMWISHPLLGVGLGCYPDLYYQHIYYVHSFEGKLHMGAHNIYLEILAELGVVGLLTYLVMILTFLLETRRLYKLGQAQPFLKGLALGLEGMMVVFLLHAIVNNLGPSDKIEIAFWTTCGLASAARCVLQKELERDGTRT
jgi:hypothetical protein